MRRRRLALAHSALSAFLLSLALSLACSQAPQTTEAPASTAFVQLAADTKTTTAAGSTFTAPAGWSVATRGTATVIQAPEGDTRIAFVDVRANDSDAAVAAAWAVYGSAKTWPLKVATNAPDKDGWTHVRTFDYQTSPNERRDVQVITRQAGEMWTVTIADLAQATEEKRLAQIALMFDELFPKGYTRETFAGKKANTLDAARIAALSKVVEDGMKALRVPGVAVGIIQDGKIVFADGFGVKNLGNPARPDADTAFMIASNTKALTTLMLAKLVDEKKFTWETPVTTLLPSFRLGNADTTRQVLVKHLICACTGLPRQDLEWLMQFKDSTPESTMALLGTIQPTSKFGEMFQYSNLLAAAAGFVGGHVAYPSLELGAAYDQAMRTRVFGPLSMSATTFDYAKAQAGNHASPHGPTIDGTPDHAVMAVNYSAIPVRPAGAGWSSVRDMLKYIQMELDEGMLPNGTRYIPKDTLFARRERQVPIGKDAVYGMGLMVDRAYEVAVVHHGGDMIGFHSDMMWLPDHHVGAVILTNADPGWILRSVFRRKLLEVLFDGRPEADADVAAQAKTFFDQLGADRKRLTLPVPAADAALLVPHYTNAALGDITVTRAGATVIFDFSEWKSEVASRHNPDGTVSFLTTVPGMTGVEFVVGKGPGPTLITRDAQHEYTFTAK